MTRIQRSVVRELVISDTQRLISGRKPNQRLKFKERPAVRSVWVCQSTAAALIESGVLERESPGIYAVTMRARVDYIQEISARRKARELAIIAR